MLLEITKPKLIISSVGLQSAKLEWTIPQFPKPELITGFQLKSNRRPFQKFEKNLYEYLFTDAESGQKYEFDVVTLAHSLVGNGPQSNTIILQCPNRPLPPLILQLPSVKPNSVVIGWKPSETKTSSKFDQINLYKVFLNKKFHGDVFSTKLNSYSYIIDDLISGKPYDVMVQAFCGELLKQPVEGPIVNCMIASEFSNSLSVTPTAPPSAVRLRLAAVYQDGFDITWSFPQQFGLATVSGYQLIRDGKLYKNIIAPDVSCYRINDVEIGQIITLQIISLTKHSFVDYDKEANTDNSNKDMKNSQVFHPKYPACKPGPALKLKLTGIINPEIRVMVENITGFSAVVNFPINENSNHYVEPDYYLLSYWPGIQKNDKAKEIKIKEKSVLLNNLESATIYSVKAKSIREASSKNCEQIIEADDEIEYKFTIYSKSSSVQFQTASPPDPPTNLSVVSTTCHSIKISWYPPIDYGSKIIAIIVDYHRLDNENDEHVFRELSPDSNTCIIDKLCEKTKYLITVTALTEEYMIYNKIRDMKQFSKLLVSPVKKTPWLSFGQVEAMTSGTDPGKIIDLRLISSRSIEVFWDQVRVYGSNRLVNQVLYYKEIDNKIVKVELNKNTQSFKLNNLKIGVKYQVYIKFIVCVKLNVNAATINSEDDIDRRTFLKDYRFEDFSCEPSVIRIPAPCKPVKLYLTGYSADKIDLYWSKPNLYSQYEDPDNPNQILHIYRKLVRYRLEVNGVNYSDIESLDSEKQCFTLIKCKPGKTYSILIYAQTCIPNDNEIEYEVDSGEIDESPSEPLKVTTLKTTDNLDLVNVEFQDINDITEPKSTGRIKLAWEVKDNSIIDKFNAMLVSPIKQKRSYESTVKFCYIPVTEPRTIYEINLEIVMKTERFSSEKLHIEVAGSPDPPILWIKKIKDNDVTLRWSEPRIYQGIKVSGFQIYVNSVKLDTKIDSKVFTKTISLIPNRSFDIDIQSLSSSSKYSDSLHSNIVKPWTNNKIKNHDKFLPFFYAKVENYEEREKLYKITSSLVNKRDQLFKLDSNPANKINQRINWAIMNCLDVINEMSGNFEVNLSWKYDQPNPLVKILGFRVYVNGKQYGCDLSDTVRSIPIKLSAKISIHHIHVTMHTNLPIVESHNSNVINVSIEHFLPFSFYCFKHLHVKNISLLDKRRCAYSDTFEIEKRVKNQEIVNMGFQNQFFPKCQVIEINSKKRKYLVGPNSEITKPIIILLWTKSCLASIRILNYLLLYSKQYSDINDFVSVHHGSEDLHDLYDLLKRGGYFGSNMKFVNDIPYTIRQSGYESSLTESFGIKSIPTLLVVNTEGLVVWKGRYCAYDYQTFENFLNHMLSESLYTKCPVIECENCKEEISIDYEMNESSRRPSLKDTKSVKRVVFRDASFYEQELIHRFIPKKRSKSETELEPKRKKINKLSNSNSLTSLLNRPFYPRSHLNQLRNPI